MRALTRIFLILTLLTFAGLMGNILAEPVGDWLERHSEQHLSEAEQLIGQHHLNHLADKLATLKGQC